MNTLLAQLKYRSKAVVVAVVTVLSAAGVAALQDPKIQDAVLLLVPAQYQPVAVLILGAIVTAVVHQVRMGAKPVPTTSTAPVTELTDSPATSIIPTITSGH